MDFLKKLLKRSKAKEIYFTDSIPESLGTTDLDFRNGLLKWTALLSRITNYRQQSSTENLKEVYASTKFLIQDMIVMGALEVEAQYKLEFVGGAFPLIHQYIPGKEVRYLDLVALEQVLLNFAEENGLESLYHFSYVESGEKISYHSVTEMPYIRDICDLNLYK